jgi:methionyl-tRNA formyltransferase
MVEVLERLGELTPVPQPEDGVTYASKIEKHEARLDFTQPAVAVERQVRAFNPAPGAFFEFGGERIKSFLTQRSRRRAGRAGSVIDPALTIGLRRRSDRPDAVRAPGATSMTPSELLRGFLNNLWARSWGDSLPPHRLNMTGGRSWAGSGRRTARRCSRRSRRR